MAGATPWRLRLRSYRYRTWTRDGVCRDGARVPLPWNTKAAPNHGFSHTKPAAEPWLPEDAGWGNNTVKMQHNDPESTLALGTKALEMRRLLWKNGVCERSAAFFVAVAMGMEPVQLPAGTVLLSAEPLDQDGLLHPHDAVWVLRLRPVRFGPSAFQTHPGFTITCSCSQRAKSYGRSNALIDGAFDGQCVFPGCAH